MMKVMIIEDEAKAAREMERMLSKIDDAIEVVAVADSVEEAVKIFNSSEAPDMIFSDIQLADGLCFDIFRQVKVLSPVVFCTAFDEYLMQAFETNAVSYLLKPVTPEKLAAAVHKFRELRTTFQKEQSHTKMQSLLTQLPVKYKTTLLVYERDKIIPLAVKDIAFVRLDNSILTVKTSGNQKFYVQSTIDELEQALDPSVFYRANRQFLISRDAITSVERFFARKLVVKLSAETPEAVVVSKAKASDFLRWLENGV